MDAPDDQNTEKKYSLRIRSHPYRPELQGKNSAKKLGSRRGSSASGSGDITVERETQYTPVPKEHCIYFLIEDDVSDMKLYNALGLVGLVLASDCHNLCNQISGFNTLFALLEKKMLTSREAFRHFSAYGYEIYPVVIKDFNSLCQNVSFLNVATRKDLSRIFDKELLVAPLSLISTSIDCSSRLCNLRSLEYARPRNTIALCGAVFLLAFKLPLQSRHDTWTSVAWMKLKVASGGLFYSRSVHDSILPGYYTSWKINMFFSASFEIRKLMFQTVMRKGEDSDCWGSVCRTVVSLAKFTELEHINYISTYILRLYPNIRRAPILRDEFVLLFEALKAVSRAEIAEEALPYLKLLRRDALSERLNRDKFSKLLYIADKIGSRSNEKLGVYSDCVLFDDNTEMKNQLDEIVEDASTVSEAGETDFHHVKTMLDLTTIFTAIEE